MTETKSPWKTPKDHPLRPHPNSIVLTRDQPPVSSWWTESVSWEDFSARAKIRATEASWIGKTHHG